MLGDWVGLGTKTKAKAFSKGSSGRRIKTISFAEDTVILLQRYFDQERVRFDPQGYPLDLYLELAARKQADLSTIPLFLSQQGTQLTPKEYREHYWNPACAAVGIEVDVHQARHWHVTREVRDIYETARNAKEVEQRMRDLVDYMKWKSKETLGVYEHYFKQQQHADTRDDFQKRLHTEVQQHLEEWQQGKRAKTLSHKPKDAPPAIPVQQFDDEPDLKFLYSLAGQG
jgi:hypothetical protein